MEKQKLLDIQELNVQFKTESGIVTAVNGISFTLHRGETVGIVGESGSGKSVTSLSIMRLINEPPGKIAGGQILYYPNTSNETPIDLLQLSEEEMRKYEAMNLR